mmetsp:Transcript_49701/g.158741  ORF Transcript_49701/g.158741 Transcript_49701/m.158741 type:complete len:107 (-) Transcript_49701:417-737(-)
MASMFARAAARGLRQVASQGSAGLLAPAAAATRSAAPRCHGSFQQTRGMAGGPGGVTYEGLTLHPAKKIHTYVGEGMATIMWLWIFWRAKEDGDVFLVRSPPLESM